MQKSLISCVFHFLYDHQVVRYIVICLVVIFWLFSFSYNPLVQAAAFVVICIATMDFVFCVFREHSPRFWRKTDYWYYFVALVTACFTLVSVWNENNLKQALVFTTEQNAHTSDLVSILIRKYVSCGQIESTDEHAGGSTYCEQDEPNIENILKYLEETENNQNDCLITTSILSQFQLNRLECLSLKFQKENSTSGSNINKIHNKITHPGTFDFRFTLVNHLIQIGEKNSLATRLWEMISSNDSTYNQSNTEKQIENAKYWSSLSTLAAIVAGAVALGIRLARVRYDVEKTPSTN